MKIQEAILQEYIDLLQETKRLNRRIKEISTTLKETGSFSTPHYVCAITLQERLSLRTIREFEEKLGSETLKELDLVRLITFETIKVSKKD